MQKTTYTIQEIEKCRLSASNHSSDELKKMLSDANTYYDRHEVTKMWRDAIVVSFSPYIR